MMNLDEGVKVVQIAKVRDNDVEGQDQNTESAEQ
jgi:hypothetical protein